MSSGRTSSPRDDPSTVPIQPRPIQTRVVYFRFLGFVITAVMRHWKPGDSGKDGRCKLCPKCRAYDDGCLMVFGKRIPRNEADLIASVGMVRVGTPTPDRVGVKSDGYRGETAV